MKKKLISGLFLMLWMALLIAAMVYPQGIFPVLAASGVWVACLLTWAVTVRWLPRGPAPCHGSTAISWRRNHDLSVYQRNNYFRWHRA